ncbi:hypothetical protein A3D79_02255 [Candidatus Daviesbacteria bacterium RIFCSPHIGHO2_02_FULL_39_8]|nr:MAG: hypothetical protein A3D79_02255 [Candidatus Daviesbacteria bacterium RIFCSPHIGHO2_02_FULL_39_8]
MGKKNLKLLGEKIKQYRKKRDLTQVELAVIVDVSTGYIGSIEQGLRYPSLRLLEKLARALKVSPKDLL